MIMYIKMATTLFSLVTKINLMTRLVNYVQWRGLWHFHSFDGLSSQTVVLRREMARTMEEY